MKAVFYSFHTPSEDQIAATSDLGCDGLVALKGMPDINVRATAEDLGAMAEREVNRIRAAMTENGSNVLVLGGGLPEFWLHMIALSPQTFSNAYTSTTERTAPDSKVFKHVQYRKLPSLLPR